MALSADCAEVRPFRLIPHNSEGCIADHGHRYRVCELSPMIRHSAGRQGCRNWNLYAARIYPVSFFNNVSLSSRAQVAVAADKVDKVVEIVAAMTSAIGDSQIFVLDLDTAVCIRPGETVDIFRHSDKIGSALSAKILTTKGSQDEQTKDPQGSHSGVDGAST